MRYIFLPVLLFQTFLCAEIVQLDPIWQDKESGFERCLMIQNSVEYINELLKYIPIPSLTRTRIEYEMNCIRLNLGIPVEIDYPINSVIITTPLNPAPPPVAVLSKRSYPPEPPPP